MKRTGRVELLAPAGSPEGFYGAVHAGADAVYLGGSRFGARAYAENFTTEELVDCIRFGRLFGVKIYLTVNTLLKEQELKELPEYLEPFYREGLTGVIVQDLGVLRLVRGWFPGLEIHASTQMTLCNRHGAKLLKELGACRIVPARELSLDELSAIKREVDIELETFVHGAMCYCYSGQCLFSSILGGRSGNRGRCAQPCRLPYTTTKKGGRRSVGAIPSYPLSLKDMCTIKHLPALIEAGIDSFKIEGRMKKPEYAAGVTAMYRKYIDSYYELRDRLGPEEAARVYGVEEQDWRTLTSLYIRSDLQEGYYFQKNGPQMVTLDKPAYSATEEVLLAEIRREHLAERPRLPIKVEAAFLPEQPAVVILRRGDVFGRAEGEIVPRAENQPITEENVRKQLGKLGDSSFRAVEMQIQVGEDAFYPLKQINELRRLAVRDLEEKLLESLNKEEKDRPDQSMKNGKERPDWSTRKSVNLKNLENTTVFRDLNLVGNDKSSFQEDFMGQRCGWTVSVRTIQQLESLYSFWREFQREAKAAATGQGLEIMIKEGNLQKTSQDSVIKNGDSELCRIYVDGDLLVTEPERTIDVCRKFITEKGKPILFLTLPYVLRKNDEAYLEHLWNLVENGPFEGFLIRSLDGLGFLWERMKPAFSEAYSEHKGMQGKNYRLRADVGLYVWNSLAADELSGLIEGFCIPYELNAAEQRELLRGIAGGGRAISCEKIVYGYIPMMVTANCVVKTTEGCHRENGDTVWLSDRYKKEFPVLTNCLHCMNLIYNSLPLALFSEVKSQKRIGELRLDFTVETGEETAQILRIFWQGGRLPDNLYTTGHEKRGVE